MRKFTTLFLLALAMTIGADQAFAQSNNDTGSFDRTERGDPPGPGDDGPEKDTDKDDPRVPRRLLGADLPCLIGTAAFECPPPRRPKKKLVLVEKEPADCGCKNKTVRVGARFVTVIDCYYQRVSVNGREQTRYCTKDD